MAMKISLEKGEELSLELANNLSEVLQAFSNLNFHDIDIHSQLGIILTGAGKFHFAVVAAAIEKMSSKGRKEALDTLRKHIDYLEKVLNKDNDSKND